MYFLQNVAPNKTCSFNVVETNITKSCKVSCIRFIVLTQQKNKEMENAKEEST